MNKPSGSVLLVSLWATATLAALGISQAARVSLELKWASRLQEERQAWYLAWTGLQVESIRLASDDKPNFDAMNEAWAVPTQEPIPLENGTFSFSVSDEQTKIPLNAAPADVVARLPGFSQAAADALVALRGQDPARRVAHLGELTSMNLPGFDPQLLTELASQATVHGDSVNINTASVEVLTQLFLYAQSPNPADLARRVVEFRQGGGVFEKTEEIQPNLGLLPDNADYIALNKLISFKLLGVNSAFFRVEVEGQTDRHGIRKKVTAILERGSDGSLPKVRGWHEPRPS